VTDPSGVHSIDELDVLFADLQADVSVEERLEVVWQYYERSTGSAPTRPPTGDERRLVHDWLYSRDGGPPALGVRRLRFVSDASLSTKTKASSMAMRRCSVCRPLSNLPGTHSFPIDIDPWSAQSSPEHNTRIKPLIRHELQQRASFKSPKAGPFCVKVVAVVPKAKRLMDADNLCKGLLDSLSEVVYEDDRDIQCVMSQRLLWNGAVGTGYYIVGVTQVEGFDEDVIWDDPGPPKMAIGYRID
jgi:hypothetical protein